MKSDTFTKCISAHSTKIKWLYNMFTYSTPMRKCLKKPHSSDVLMLFLYMQSVYWINITNSEIRKPALNIHTLHVVCWHWYTFWQPFKYFFKSAQSIFLGLVKNLTQTSHVNCVYLSWVPLMLTFNNILRTWLHTSILSKD